MSQVEEKTPEWLVPNWIPKGQIVVLAGDGGSGKTTIWCAVAAAISNGGRCFLNHRESPGDENPFEKSGGRKVLYFSSEDSAEYTLRRRLRQNGANLDNILSLDITDPRFCEVKFNSPILEDFIQEETPALVVFDPIQSFIPPEIQMGQRNAMRACMNPLIGLGEKYGVSFLVIVHTNKQVGLWGRKRMADSADIWDIARCVWLSGDADGGVRYVSQEKNNYAPLAETVLFRLQDGPIIFEGHTTKRDREFVIASARVTHQAPQRDLAKELILEYLEDGEEKEVSDLNEAMKAMSVSDATLERAKQDLKNDGKIRIWSRGFKPKTWLCQLVKESHVSSDNLK